MPRLVKLLCSESRSFVQHVSDVRVDTLTASAYAGHVTGGTDTCQWCAARLPLKALGLTVRVGAFPETRSNTAFLACPRCARYLAQRRTLAFDGVAWSHRALWSMAVGAAMFDLDVGEAQVRQIVLLPTWGAVKTALLLANSLKAALSSAITSRSLSEMGTPTLRAAPTPDAAITVSPSLNPHQREMRARALCGLRGELVLPVVVVPDSGAIEDWHLEEAQLLSPNRRSVLVAKEGAPSANSTSGMFTLSAHVSGSASTHRSLAHSFSLS